MASPMGQNTEQLEPSFEPTMDAKVTRQALNYLKKNPLQFNDEQKTKLEQHAAYYGLPYYDGEFNVGEAIWQAVGGFVEGFTTLSIADQPDNEYEAIARNIGHLAGFAPGILAAPAKYVGLKGAAKMFSSLNDASVPMAVAKIATKKAKDIAKPIFSSALKGRSEATSLAANVLTGNRARHIMEGAFHLGVASSVSAWQGGVDQMMEAFIGGAQAGAVFRVIGNLASHNPTAGQKVVKTMAGSLFMGLPATMRGATTPEQVYEYLLGAYFGGKEVPWTVAKVNKGIVAMRKKALKDPEFAKTMDPEMLPEWKTMPEEVKPLLKEKAKEIFKDPLENLAAAELLAIATENEKRLGEQSIVTPEGVKLKRLYRQGEERLEIDEASTKKYNNYIISGGTQGMESIISSEAKKRGVPIFHYTSKRNSKPGNISGEEIPLTNRELEAANKEIKKAESSLMAKAGDLTQFELNNVKRGWTQVKNSQGVYMFGYLTPNNQRAKGLLGWTAQMAINNNKPVHIYDMARKKWYAYEPSVNKFVNVSEPAKPPRRVAILGQHKIVTKGAKEEAVKFFNKHFKNVKAVESTTESPKQKLELEQIDNRLEEIKQRADLLEVGSEISEKELAQERAEAAKLEARKKELNKEISDQQYVEDPIETKDPDIDVGMVEDRTVGKVSFYFADRYLKNIWDSAPDATSKVVEKVRIAQKIENAILKYLNPGSKRNRSPEWANEIEQWVKDEYQIKKFNLDMDARLVMRSWMRRRNTDRNVRQFILEEGKVKFLDKDDPITRTGNRKLIREPQKRIEEVFEDANGEGPAYFLFDTISKRTKDGWKDFKLSDERRNLKTSEWKQLIGNVIKQMDKKGYYLYGGAGDKNQLFFVKYHPELKKANKFLKQFTDFESTYLQKDIQEASEYGMDKNTYKKQWQSNLLYEASLNGMTPEAYVDAITTNPEGFIQTAKAWNKRAQVWWTNSYSGDGEFVESYLSQTKGAKNDLVDGRYKYKIENDSKLSKEEWADLRNSEMAEHVDGMIIVRDDIIDAINADAGMPSSGQNKSFIISPHAQKGAMLGKYMMHAAGKQQSADMMKEGLHFKIMDSAAKQRGKRDYDTPYTDLSPADIKYNMSTKQTEHMLEPQRIPKQLMGALVNHAMYNIDQSTINDFFNGVIEKRFEGQKKYNDMLKDYTDLVNSENYNQKTADKMLNEIDKNFEKLGMLELLSAMRIPNNHLFTEKAWERVLKLNNESLAAEHAAGEITAEVYTDKINEISEFTSIADRMISRSREWTAEQRKAGRDVSSVSTFLHKFVNHYRMQSMRNYMVDSISKPKIDNSGVGRIRPADSYLRRDADKVNPRLKELETNDEIFFLDNAYKDMNVYVGNKRMRLEDVYSKYEKMKDKTTPEAKKLAEVFESVVMRVPMDSISGAHKLEFAGFTGRKGHGILMHSRAMRALGGADLDGDEAWFFMGGERGFQPKWKDAFATNKKEFYEYTNGKKKISPLEYDKLTPKQKALYRPLVKDNKSSIVQYGVHKGKSHRDVLANELTKEQKNREDSFEYLFSPIHRAEVSKRTVDGRNMLGTAVTQKQIMSSMYAAIQAAGGKETFEFGRKGKDGKWTNYKVTIGLEDSKQAQQAAREMGRAQVAFGSDPMDESGLKGTNVWFKALWDLHFKTLNVQKKVGKKWVKAPFNEAELKPWELKKGSYDKLAKMNSAFYSKDYEANRKWSLQQIKEMSDGVWDFDAQQNNTLLTKVGRLLNKSVELIEDNMINRVNRDAIRELYAEIETKAKGNEWLKTLLGRNTFRSSLNNDIDNVLRYKLNTSQGMEDAINDYKIYSKALQGTMFDNNTHRLKGSEAYEKQGERAAREYRAKILRHMANEANNFFLNDITDATTVELLLPLAEKIPNPEVAIPRIHKKVEELKQKSSLMAKARARSNDLPLSENLEALITDPVIKEMHKEAKKQIPFLRDSSPKDNVKTSSELDQVAIDARISDFKENMSKAEKDFFDVLMLGSLNRGNLDKLERFIKRVSKKDKESALVRNYLSELRKQASRTSLSRLGFQSLQVSDSNVKKFLGALSSKFDAGTKVKAGEKEVKEAIENINKDEKIEGDSTKEIQDLVEMSEKEITGYEKLEGAGKKVRLDAETKKIIMRIAGNLKSYDPHVRRGLSELVRGLFAKDLNVMNYEDFKIFDSWLTDMKTGTIWQRMFDKKGFLNISKRHWYLFPSTIGREFMKEDMQLLYERGWFFSAEGKRVKGDIARPSSYINVIQSWIGRMNDSASQKTDELIQALQKRLVFINTIEQGEVLREIAVRMREKGYAEEVLLKSDKIDPSKKHAQIKDYLSKWEETTKKYNWNELRNQKFNIDLIGERKEMTGEQIVDEINKAYTQTFAQMHKLIKGDPKALEPFVQGHYDAQKLYPKLDYKKFINHLSEAWKRGEDVSDKFGIDGLRMIAREMMGNMIGEADFQKAFRLSTLESTGKIQYEYYWPHMFFNKKEASKYLEKTANNILKDPNMTKEDKLSDLQKLMYRNKSLTGDWEFGDITDWQAFDVALNSIASKKSNKKDIIKHFNADERAGSMHSRSTHVSGWSVDANVPESYIKNISNTYYRQLSQIFSRDVIDRMGEQMLGKYPKEQQVAWSNFMKLYVQGAMGNPDVIPDYVLNNKNMKLQGTLYAKWADDKVLERVNKIGEKLGLIKKGGKLPKELTQFDMNQLRHWSNLEAQFEMASLLVHPKTVTGNIFGGSLHTIQSAGWRNWRNSFNYSYLSKINPEWTGPEQVDRFVVGSGIYPERMIYEFGLSNNAQNVRNKEFISELAKKMTRNPDMSDKNVFDLGRKYGVTDKVMNWAAKWMSVPERKIRRDAFMAHYVHWWNKFGGAIKDYNDPFLIELAKKGVKATQFLYSAPYRPAFARTSLGKVMSRFQTWSWNAVKFRNEVNRQARIYGYREGTPEYERFKRTTQIDMFVFALGNIFAYSLFDTAMPAPYTWFEDTAQWLFGDEKERDKAFFGTYPRPIAPLQAITPPIARIPNATIASIYNDDYNRLAQYYVYTMFPFGRLLRDFSPFAEGNVIDNPINAINRWTGMPLLSLQKKVTKNKKDPVEKIYPKGLL